MLAARRRLPAGGEGCEVPSPVHLAHRVLRLGREGEPSEFGAGERAVEVNPTEGEVCGVVGDVDGLGDGFVEVAETLLTAPVG